MKLKFKHHDKEPEQEQRPRRGRKKTLGGTRAHFFPGEKLAAALAQFQADMRKKGISVPSASNVFRAGAWLYIRKQYAKLKMADNGELHAKSRKQ